MLGYGGIANIKKCGEFANRAILVDQLADDHQAVGAGQRLEEFGRMVSRDLHGFGIYFHTCVDTILRIYVKH